MTEELTKKLTEKLTEKMHCLGIEGTAHTFGIGIVSFEIDKKNSGKSEDRVINQRILSNEKDSFSSEEGGMIPNIVAEHHKNTADNILTNTLRKANLKMRDIDFIAFSQGPGLAPCLLQTMNFAKRSKYSDNY